VEVLKVNVSRWIPVGTLAVSIVTLVLIAGLWTRTPEASGELTSVQESVAAVADEVAALRAAVGEPGNVIGTTPGLYGRLDELASQVGAPDGLTDRDLEPLRDALDLIDARLQDICTRVGC
jgi:hypothetical protein